MKNGPAVEAVLLDMVARLDAKPIVPTNLAAVNTPNDIYF